VKWYWVYWIYKK